MPRIGYKERILAMVVEAIPDPPCLQCTWKAYCRINAVACKNFKAYTNEGYRIIPGAKNEPWPKYGPKPDLKLGEAKDV